MRTVRFVFKKKINKNNEKLTIGVSVQHRFCALADFFFTIAVLIINDTVHKKSQFFDLQKKAHISLEEMKTRSQVNWEILM